jgi:serine protease AprX
MIERLLCKAVSERTIPAPASPKNFLKKSPLRVAMSGTSMSAPHVTGIVALMLEKNPELTAAQIRKILIASASAPPGVTPFDPAWGFGRVDAKAAIDLIE